MKSGFALEFDWWFWKPSKEAGGVRFLAGSDLPYTGFASIYAVREADSDAIRAAGTIAGFSGTVWSPSLWVDCDSEEASHSVERRLRQASIAYQKYTTGNRGAHFEIERLHEPSHLLPALDRAWVQQNLPEADLSLYKHLHLLRVVGGKHEKTGQRKEKLLETSGRVLTAEDYRNLDVSVLPKESAPIAVGKARGEFRCVFEDPNFEDYWTARTSGSRHHDFCVIASRLLNLGQEPAFVHEWLRNLNLITKPPLEPNEIWRILEWAYSRN